MGSSEWTKFKILLSILNTPIVLYFLFTLLVCTYCKSVELERHTYKKCSLCKKERWLQPRFYCSKQCQGKPASWCKFDSHSACQEIFCFHGTQENSLLCSHKPDISTLSKVSCVKPVLSHPVFHIHPVLSTHLCLILPSGLFPWVCPSECMHFCSVVFQRILGEEYKLRSSSWCRFHHLITLYRITEYFSASEYQWCIHLSL